LNPVHRQKSGLHSIPRTEAPLSAGFSLIELLVVVAIVGVLSVFAVGAFNATMRGTKISSSAQAVADAMRLARSSAISRNVPVQLRFYKLPEYNSAATAPVVYRGLQIFSCESRSTNPITKPFLFPQPIVASADATKSSILQLSNNPADGNRVAGLNTYTYVAMTFGPDGMIRPTGGTLTSTNEWYITIQTDRDLATDAAWPKNYATVAVNPVTGNTKVFQPR